MIKLHCKPCDKEVEPRIEIGDEGERASFDDVDSQNEIGVDIPLELNCTECGTTLQVYKLETLLYADKGQMTEHNGCFVVDGDYYEDPKFNCLGAKVTDISPKPEWVELTFDATAACAKCNDDVLLRGAENVRYTLFEDV